MLVTFACLAAIGLFLSGWRAGQKSANHLASDVLAMIMFDHAYSQIINNEVAIEQIDSGRIEDAKNTIYLNTDANILALNNVLESTNSEITLLSMKILLKMNQDTRTYYGSAQQTSNKMLARVAKYRTEHPWKYPGKMPTTSDKDVEAKLAAILKQASESQK